MSLKKVVCVGILLTALMGCSLFDSASGPKLEPFTSEVLGISALAPEGWEQVNEGHFAGDAWPIDQLIYEVYSGMSAEVVNARFVKPLDEKMLLSVLKRFDRIISVEENALSGGFGSAVMEFAEAHDISQPVIRRMGIPDTFIEHGSRGQLLSDLGLDVDGIVRMAKKIVGSTGVAKKPKARRARSRV